MHWVVHGSVSCYKSVWMEETQGHPLFQPPTTLKPFFQSHPSEPGPTTPFFKLNSLSAVPGRLVNHSGALSQALDHMETVKLFAEKTEGKERKKACMKVIYQIILKGK